MKDFIVKYWLQIVFTGIISALTAGYVKLKKRLDRNKIIELALLALLHDRLYQACTFYIEQGWCGVEDKCNLEYMFKPYSQLGGNGTCANLFNKCMDLDIHPPKNN